MPGGRYTNLKEQAAGNGRVPSVAGDRPHVRRGQRPVWRHREGDAVRKVVGDMALFLFSRGIRPADVVNLEPGTTGFESVMDMLSGGLGWPAGGFPEDVQRVVLGEKRFKEAQAAFREGARATGRPRSA